MDHLPIKAHRRRRKEARNSLIRLICSRQRHQLNSNDGQTWVQLDPDFKQTSPKAFDIDHFGSAGSCTTPTYPPRIPDPLLTTQPISPGRQEQLTTQQLRVFRTHQPVRRTTTSLSAIQVMVHSVHECWSKLVAKQRLVTGTSRSKPLGQTN